MFFAVFSAAYEGELTLRTPKRTCVEKTDQKPV